ncbi:MAG: hypothetical protein KA169_01580 [Burkholderiaceae bacterium]|jgi:hypothetical protein|nr:hypothetical protein [Burkholderiaceae bacterium]
MHSLTQDYPAILRAEHDAPCLSLYQPTHRQHPQNQQDPIRFRNLVKRLEESLRQRYASRDIPALLRPFEALAEDEAFWNHTADGLAVLAAPGLFRVYLLQRPVAELAVVADSFHTKPLMRITQSADRYQVLALNKHSFKMYEGNRDALDEMPAIEDVPQTADELLGRDAQAREGAHRAYGPAGSSNVTQQGAGVKHDAGGVVRHGTDVKQDAEDRDTEHFFRAVDRAVLKHRSQPSAKPLILAALPQHHHQFRAVSTNPNLIAEAIDVHPDALSATALRDRAWQLMQPHYLARLAGFVDAFGAANASERGADDLGRIAEAAVAGRVETLLIEADRLIPGRIHKTSGALTRDDLDKPSVDDLLDDLGEIVLRHGGEVIVVPGERMPTRSGAAAIYRYR